MQGYIRKKVKMSIGKKLLIIKVCFLAFLMMFALAIPTAILSWFEVDEEAQDDGEVEHYFVDDIDSSGAYRYEDWEDLYPQEDIDAILSDPEKYRTALQERVNLVITRINERQQEIVNAVTSSSTKRDIKKILGRALNSEQYENFEVVVEPVVISPTALDAVKLICLHSVQYEESGLASPGEILRYVGRPANETGEYSTRQTIALADTGVTVKVDRWSGTFLPQYLIEQKRQMIEKLGTDYLPAQGTAAADLLITVTSSTIGNTFVKTNTFTEMEMQLLPVEDENGIPIIGDNGEYLMELVEVEVEKTEAVAYYSVVIGVRSVDQLAEAAGLRDVFERPRSNEETAQTD